MRLISESLTKSEIWYVMLFSEILDLNKLQQLKDTVKKILMMRQKRLPKLDSPEATDSFYRIQFICFDWQGLVHLYRSCQNWDSLFVV